MTEEKPASFLDPVIGPVLEWMTANNTSTLLIRASHHQEATNESTDDTSSWLMYCEAAPAAPGLLDVYVVRDIGTGACIDGPNVIPMDIIGPLIRELSRHDVEELRIATVPESSPTPDASGAIATLQPLFETDEFCENGAPSTDNFPQIVAFLLESQRMHDEQ